MIRKIRKDALIVQFLSILIILIPALLITGPLLSDLVVTLCAIIFLIKIILDKSLKRFYKNKITFFFLIFCIYIIFNSTFISNEPFFSLKNSLFYIRFGLFSLCVWYVLEKNKKLILHVFYSLLACFLVLIIDGYIQYFLGQNILGWKLYPGPRISSFFGDELVYGSYLSRFLPILFGLMIFCIEKKYINKNIQLITFIIFVLADIAVFLSGERTAFFFINIGALLFIFSSLKYKLIRSLIFTISIFFILILSVIELDAKKRVFDQTFKDMNITTNNNIKTEQVDGDNLFKKKIYIFSKTHHEHYISAIKMFKDNPIFGIGYKNFRFYCSKEEYYISVNSCSTHPHNTYLQLLAETGLIGFIYVFVLFIYLIIIISKNILRNFLLKEDKNNINDFELCLLIAIIISIWPIAPNGNIFNNWLSILMYFPVGFILWSFKGKKLI